MPRKKNNNSDSNNAKSDTKNNTTPTSTPSIKPFEFKIKVNEFAMRGLNKYRNFLNAPECECGCGGKAMPIFDTQEELMNFCAGVLFNNGCSHAAVFLVHKNGNQEIVLTMPGYDEEADCEYIENIGSFIDNDADAFAKFDGEVGLHCYGMLIEKDDNCWEICE